MADKSFGVKELNLLNASGTPTVTSPNNLNLNANTVAISTSVTVGQNLTVSANAGIASLNVTGIATVVNFNATGISTIAQPADSNPMANWTITNNSSSAYRFTGPGQSGSDDNPDLYLVRGHRYIFKHNATSSHPIQIRFANGGSAYTDGVTYSDTGNNRTTDGNNLILNVQHDAPAQLYYQCTNHGSMVGNIYIVGGPQVISGVTTFSNGINVSGGTLDVATSLRKSSGTLDYLAATHTFANVAGSTEYFRFASSGQLGIAGANYGTSGQVLTSAGSGSAVTWSAIPAQATIANNGNDRIITGGSGVNLNGEANLQFDGTDLYVSDKIKHLGDPDTLIEFATDTITFDTAGAERFRITSSGTAVFGGDTSTPIVDNGELFYRGNSTSTFGFPQNFYLYSDDIAYNGTNPGAGMLFGGAYDSGGNYTTYAGIHGIKENSTSADADGALVFGTRQQGSNTWERLRIDSSGRLLVGQTSGSSPLCVSGTDPVVAELHHSDGGTNDQSRISLGALASNPPSQRGVNLIAENNGAGHDFIVACSASHSAGPSEKLRIKSSGQILVNNTSPFTTTTKLNIENTGAGNGMSVRCNSTSDSVPIIVRHQRASGSTYAYMIQFNNSGGSGVGAVVSNGSQTNYQTSSDYRLKENQVAISDGITRLKSLKPYRFNFKADSKKTVDGFFAHEVSPVVPEAIGGEKDAVDSDNNPVYQAIDQSKLIPLLTAALQEAITEIETLKTKVAALEGS